MNHKLIPLDPPYPKPIEETLAKYPQSDGYILRLFRTFALSERFLNGHGVNNFLDNKSPLTIREREIVINRTCANLNCEYEWGVHVSIFAKAANLTDEQIRATRQGDHKSKCWSNEDALLIETVDALCINATIQDDLLDRFQSKWTHEQQLEILALVGNYHTVSFVANTARLEPEEFGTPFPSSQV